MHTGSCGPGHRRPTDRGGASTMKHAGFVATRLAGTDGVSLETAKWAAVLKRMGIRCSFLAGELDWPAEQSVLVKEAHFNHPEVRWIDQHVWQSGARDASVTRKIHAVKDHLKERVHAFLEKYELDLRIVENALAIPMNIPLGLALTEAIAETAIPTIAHHHDFFWERERFLTNSVWDYLNMSFPPHLPFIRHVVINSSGDNQLSLRSGISATIIPNVMDFDCPPQTDEYGDDIRESLGIDEDELFVLQPTRIVKRKGIEQSIEFVAQLGLKACLVISHEGGDEGDDYEARIHEYAARMRVKTLFASKRIGDSRSRTPSGAKIYTLADVYPRADLVTYPSTFEGFGNAFLEAIYYRKPIVVNAYSVYRMDIKPQGFQCIELDGYVSDRAVEQARTILSDDAVRHAMTEANYTLGRQYYSYKVLERKLTGLIEDLPGVSPIGEKSRGGRARDSF